MQTVRPMTERPNRRSRKSQPPLGDLAVKGAVRQRGASVYRGAWSTPPVLGTGNRWFESSYADEIKQEERFEIGLWCSPLSAAWDKKVKCADQFGTVWTIN